MITIKNISCTVKRITVNGLKLCNRQRLVFISCVSERQIRKSQTEKPKAEIVLCTDGATVSDKRRNRFPNTCFTNVPITVVWIQPE